MANLLYRASDIAELPELTSVKGAPLTNLEVDANFRSINLELMTKGPTGTGSDLIFWLNNKVITQSFAIPSTKNAGSFGELTIEAGVDIDIPADSSWHIL